MGDDDSFDQGPIGVSKAGSRVSGRFRTVTTSGRFGRFSFIIFFFLFFSDHYTDDSFMLIFVFSLF